MQGVPVLQNNISVTVNDARKYLRKKLFGSKGYILWELFLSQGHILRIFKVIIFLNRTTYFYHYSYSLS